MSGNKGRNRQVGGTRHGPPMEQKSCPTQPSSLPSGGHMGSGRTQTSQGNLSGYFPTLIKGLRLSDHGNWGILVLVGQGRKLSQPVFLFHPPAFRKMGCISILAEGVLPCRRIRSPERGGGGEGPASCSLPGAAQLTSSVLRPRPVHWGP